VFPNGRRKGLRILFAAIFGLTLVLSLAGADAAEVLSSPQGKDFTEIRLNAGGPSYTDTAGRLWVADTFFTGGDTFTASTTSIQNTSDDALYQAERLGPSFAYHLPVPNGTYQVTLHFADLYFFVIGQQLFDVTLEGLKVLSHFDVFGAAGGTGIAVTRTFVTTVTDGSLDLEFTGVLQHAKVSAIEVVGHAHGGHPFLHVVIDAPPYVVDYDGNGSEPVALNGSASHTHQPGKSLTSWTWTEGAAVIGTTPQITPVLGLGRHTLTLTIGDNATPPASLPASARVNVYPIHAVGGVLATYHPGGTVAAPGPPGYVEVLPSLRVEPVAGKIGGSPFDGSLAIVLSGALSVPAAATYAFEVIGGSGGQVRVDGAIVNGPLPLSAGTHGIEVRVAVGSAEDLPVQVRTVISGGPQGLESVTVTHDETSLPPFVNGLSFPSGAELGGEPITISGLGFFATAGGQVSVHWGGVTLQGSAIQVTPTAIKLVTPPGTGTVPVTVQTPNGVSNGVSFTYIAGITPVNFTSGVIANAAPLFPTQAAWGPDGRLYVGSTEGVLEIYTFDDDYNVIATQKVETLAGVDNRSILGLAFNPFDPPSPVRVYLAHSHLFASNDGLCPTEPSPYSGQITVLTGPSFDVGQTLISGLPVSNHDHGVNTMEFDHNGDMLFTVGGMTNAGVPHCNIGGLPESPLSSAMLKAQLTKGAAFQGALSYVGAQSFADTDQRAGGEVTLAPGSDVTLFATGLRNTFDFVLTTRGRLYGSDNGADTGYGVASTGATTEGADAIDDDELNLIEIGDYYGHANRNRGRFDARQNVFRPSFAPPDLASFIGPLAILTSSSNGIAEYRAQTFNGAMRGDLLIQQFPEGQTFRLRLSADGRGVTANVPFAVDLHALDVVTGPGGVLIGTNYHDGQLTIARPNDPTPGLLVHDIHPWRGPATGGTPFVIGGQGFVPGDTTVTLGGIAMTVTSISATRIRGIVPPRPNPTADLLDVVVTSGGQSKTLPAAFRYLFPLGQEDSGARAAVVIDPGGSFAESSTFLPGSFQLTNESTRGQLIERIRIDLSTALFPDLVFDAFGTAGDSVAKPFTPDSSPDEVGLTGHVLHFPRDGGFDAIDVRFNAFAPGKTFLFSIDIDPTSVKGATPPGPNDSGSVSGLELTGARVTAYFNDGTMLVGRAFRLPGSLTGSAVALRAGLPPAPQVQVLGVASPPTVVAGPSQTVRVSGPPGATGSLLVVEAGLFTAGLPGGGFDLDPFEANSAIAVAEHPLAIPPSGFQDVPITLTKSGGAETGLNHLVAVFKDGAGRPGALSPVLILKLP
jgi:glucose/arabinose dehydrogenase